MLVTSALVIAAWRLCTHHLLPRRPDDGGACALRILDAAAGAVGRPECRVRRRRPFNLYVALEMLTFAAVPLVCPEVAPKPCRPPCAICCSPWSAWCFIARRRPVVRRAGHARHCPARPTDRQSARRRSCGLRRGADDRGIARQDGAVPASPWLPPAHANAPALASAALSALVVKGPFFLVVRPRVQRVVGQATGAAMANLGVLGSCAILFGSVLALRQARLKLLIATPRWRRSVICFLMFPPGRRSSMERHRLERRAFWRFRAAGQGRDVPGGGLVAEALGHDRLAGPRVARPGDADDGVRPGLGGLSLMGLLPSGGFFAKWLLLQATILSGQWHYAP